jgi:hypothetical protein
MAVAQGRTEFPIGATEQPPMFAPIPIRVRLAHRPHPLLNDPHWSRVTSGNLERLVRKIDYGAARRLIDAVRDVFARHVWSDDLTGG